ncbi:hypothetical protein GRX01_16950 [Halobaculum sp. WSA2]|uniref:Uncharacterized protein n=1 Tax=Halobaculum saliterrae TaxID=2073113 RepID=A0A6B0T330_9EURY|nr:hypothetical protein [Halobaculum saliterrae]MXR43021.1 hypothetical protein [Halobaculum saliterrae]
MTDQPETAETELSEAVEDAIARAGHSLLSTIFWSVLAIFTVLVGAQAIQFGVAGSGLGALGLIVLGAFISLCSLYLLYSLHWTS